MFDKLDLNNLGDILNEVQKKATQVEEEISQKYYEAKSGGGMVVVKANGKGEVFDIDIDDSLLQDKESLQILLISAINEIFKEIDQGKKEATMNMLGSLNPFQSTNHKSE
jgi:DNA-binding YbaB/EbfC family protein